jgi:hypothetical protein
MYELVAYFEESWGAFVEELVPDDLNLFAEHANRQLVTLNAMQIARMGFWRRKNEFVAPGAIRLVKVRKVKK